MALQCGYGVAFPGVRSLGRDRFELVSSRGVRFDAFSHFPTPCFSPQPSDISFEDRNMHLGAQSQFLTHRVSCIFQAFTAEVTRSVSRHDPLSSARMYIFQTVEIMRDPVTTVIITKATCICRSYSIFTCCALKVVSLYRGVGGCVAQEGDRSLGC